ncbi:MAG: hypothetical protein ABGX42_00745, partial [Gammaproteobacteria bacterium]
MLKKSFYVITLFLLVYILFVTLAANGSLGRYEAPGEVTPMSQPLDILEKRVTDQLLAKKRLGIKDP